MISPVTDIWCTGIAEQPHAREDHQRTQSGSAEPTSSALRQPIIRKITPTTKYRAETAGSRTDRRGARFV